VLAVRNQLVHALYIRLINEEYKFMVEHADFMIANKKEWLRKNSLPSYSKMLLSIWIPLRQYERPLTDFYKIGNGDNKWQ
jgi:hypothetical protein